MKQKFYKFSLPFVFVIVCAVAANAQKTDEKPLSEITDFRQKLVQAIEKRDRKSLETMFAEDFTHTHAIGRVDSKAKRVEVILMGDKTLESVQPDEIAIRLYGKKTAIAVGQTTIETAVYRWTVVYVKTGKKWQIAASQATKF